jgi:hypothetical protein
MPVENSIEICKTALLDIVDLLQKLQDIQAEILENLIDE